MQESAECERSACDYAACYCEENVYRLTQRLLAEDPSRELEAAFISNASKTVLLLEQRAGDEDGVVCWDYHVVLIERRRGQSSLIWDLDTRLAFPCEAVRYVRETFPAAERIREEYGALIRLVPAHAFLARFSSDRSHMLRESGYAMPPPAWRPIRGAAAASAHELSAFIRMDASPSVADISRVVTPRELLESLET